MLDKALNLLPEQFRGHFITATNRFEINTPLRIAHFLSQTAHESTNFTRLEENLNYSAEGLISTFGRYFDRPTALIYARQPIAIASRVYANRLGNGPESTREGWTYRGRGLIQLTGKENYKKFSDFANLDFVTLPDLLKEPEYAMLSAGWFWDGNKLNLLADEGSTEAVVKKITKRINGGYNGLADRIEKFYTIYKIVS